MNKNLTRCLRQAHCILLCLERKSDLAHLREMEWHVDIGFWDLADLVDWRVFRHSDDPGINICRRTGVEPNKLDDLSDDLHQSARMRNAQRMKPEAVDEAEDSGAGADAEGESEHSRSGKARSTAHLAKCVANVTSQFAHLAQSPFVYSMRSARIGSMEAARRAG